MDLSIVPKIAALLIPLAGIALPVLIVFIVLHFRQRQREKLYETVKHFADRGLPVPTELLDPPQPPKTDRVSESARFYAITLVGVGVGLALMFWGMELPRLLGIGALVGCIGIAQLVAIGLDRRERSAPPAHDDGPR